MYHLIISLSSFYYHSYIFPLFYDKYRFLYFNNNNHTNNNNNNNNTFYIIYFKIKINSSILQVWKRSLHEPLRLDIYYQYDTMEDESLPNNNNNNTIRQKVLLERWNIDYVAYSSDDIQNNKVRNNTSNDTISQLRQVW